MGVNSNAEILTFRCGYDLAKCLYGEADKKGEAVSALVRVALVEYLDRRGHEGLSPDLPVYKKPGRRRKRFTDVA
jgi:hypothetical protein